MKKAFNITLLLFFVICLFLSCGHRIKKKEVESDETEAKNNLADKFSLEEILKSKDGVKMLEVTFEYSNGFDGDWMYIFTNKKSGEEIEFLVPRNGCEYPEYIRDVDYASGTEIENEGKSGVIYYTDAICYETVWEEEIETDDVAKNTRTVLLLFKPFD